MRFQILRIALRRLFKVDAGLFEISKKEIRASQHQEIEIPRCRIEAHRRPHQRYGRGRLSGKCPDTRHQGVAVGKRWIERQGSLQMLQRLLVLAPLRMNVRERPIGFRNVRVDLVCGARQLARTIEPLRPELSSGASLGEKNVKAQPLVDALNCSGNEVATFDMTPDLAPGSTLHRRKPYDRKAG